MPCIITYSLKPEAASSDDYYRTISAYAESWIARTNSQVHELVTGFRAFRMGRGELDRSDAEYAFELLTLGVLLREHRQDIFIPPKWTGQWLQWLLASQERHPRAERIFKAMRGWLGWFSRSVSARRQGGDLSRALIAWLTTNDETVKAARLSQWQDYFDQSGNIVKQDAIALCLKLAEEFAETSLETLGKYTQDVEPFLVKEAPKHRHRYDVRLLTNTRQEYHLGMLGTEILNQVFRQSFLATARKMVILPPCMCAPAEKCLAVETPLGAKCQACTPGCRVNQITKLGEKRGFGVTMIPDNVKIFSSGEGLESVGLVGISCALTNWNGGWETGSLGIPAQGVLLDYVGCKIHWDKVGFPTDVNLKKLQEILNV